MPPHAINDYDGASALAPPIMRHAYLENGAHWRTRSFGIAATSCVCLTLVASALFSWNSASISSVHLSSAPLSVVQMNSAANPSALAQDSTPPSQQPQSEPSPADQPQTQPSPSAQPSGTPATAPTLTPSPTPVGAARAALSAPTNNNARPSPASPSAPASSSAPSQPKSSASAPPPSGQARASWEGELLRHLEKFRRYPSAARVRGQEGVAYVTFTMNRAGQVIACHVVQSSKVQILDRAALDTLRRAQPLPRIPAEFADVLEITLPVEFFIDR